MWREITAVDPSRNALFALTPDQRALSVQIGPGRILAIATKRPLWRKELRIPQDTVRATVSPGGDAVVFNQDQMVLREPVRATHVVTGRVRGLSYAPDGSVVVITHSEPGALCLTVLDGVSFRQVASVRVPCSGEGPHVLSWKVDSCDLCVGTIISQEGADCSVFRLGGGRCDLVRRFVVSGEVTHVAVCSTESRLAAAVTFREIIVCPEFEAQPPLNLPDDLVVCGRPDLVEGDLIVPAFSENAGETVLLHCDVKQAEIREREVVARDNWEVQVQGAFLRCWRTRRDAVLFARHDAEFAW